MTTFMGIRDVDSWSRTSRRFLSLFEQAHYRQFELKANTRTDPNIIPLSLNRNAFCLTNRFPNYIYRAYNRSLVFVANRCMEVALALLYGLVLMGGVFHVVIWTVLDIEDRKAAIAFLSYRIGYYILSILMPEIVKLSIIGACAIEGNFSSTVETVSERMVLENTYFRLLELFRKRNMRLYSSR